MAERKHEDGRRFSMNEDEEKLIRVIETSQTEDHLIAALEMADRFVQKYTFGQEHVTTIFNRLRVLRGE